MAILKVRTEDGVVLGLPCEDHEVSVFKGIPFAAPPVGELRWRAPQPVVPWEGEYHAYQQKAIPVQDISGAKFREFGGEIYPISEDCLYLNVWTPAKSVCGELLPVVVWVYGGAYKTGSCTNRIIDGESFARSGCVFVSFNYRMGPIGFLAHPQLTEEDEHHTSGNYGILDQIRALNWVKKNIAAFGGDPDCITLIGQSAGAHSVMTLCNSPLSSGLMKRAIIHSTSGLSPMYYHDEQSLAEAEQGGVELLKTLGITSIEQARAVNALELTRKLINARYHNRSAWFPRTDGYVLPIGTISSIMTNHQAKIDYLSGSTSYEAGSSPGFHSDNPDKINSFAHTYFPDDVQGYLQTVKQGTTEEIRRSIFDQYGNDKLCALLAWQELELKRNGNTFYQYYYTKDQPGEDHSGACHSSDLPYVLKSLPNNHRPYDISDYRLSEVIHQYWVNFVKTGNPNGNALPVWDRYDSRHKQLMELGQHVGMIDIPWDRNKEFIVDYMLKQADKLAGIRPAAE